MRDKYILRVNSIVPSLIISLIGISTFNLLPVVFPSTSGFSYVLIFVFTIYFLLKTFFSKSLGTLPVQFNVLYIFLMLWTSVIFFWAVNFDYDFLRSLFISPYVFLPYLFPITARYFSITDLRKILFFIYYVNIIYILFIILFFIQPSNNILTSIGFIEDVNKYLAFPNFLMLFFFAKLSSKEKSLSIIVFLIGFVISIYAARRSLSFTFGCASILAIYLAYTYNKESVVKQIRLLIVMFFCGIVVYFIYKKYEKVLFGNLVSRIDSDSRRTFLNDFYGDMRMEDFIFGKGLNGTYLLRESDRRKMLGNYSINRNIIEAGYLNILLKGGYILLILLLVIYLVAIYNGFFKSKNNYSKAFAAFILLHILEAYPAGILTFNLRFFLIWFCIAMCWNKRFLKTPDSSLNLLLTKTRI